MITKNVNDAWILAARPKTLSGAAAPVLIGCALAYSDGVFNWVPALLCLLFAALMQIDANFINYLFDFLKGKDTEERLGPKRACAQGWVTPKAMKVAIIITTILAVLVGLSLLFFAGYELILLGLFCLLFAFLYTAGPYPLAYHGYGDILVVVFFGLVPVCGTYYVMSHNVSAASMIAAFACGLVVDTLLMVNNFRDRVEDAANGKRTIVVRLGEKVGAALYLWLGIAAVVCCLFLMVYGFIYAAVLPMLYIPLHYATWKKMVRINHGKELNSILGSTSRNIIIFSLLLIIGILIDTLC